jgi:hypothetical protein
MGMSATNAVAKLPPPSSEEHLPQKLSPARERLRAAIAREKAIGKEVEALTAKQQRLEQPIKDRDAAYVRVSECKAADQAKLAAWIADPGNNPRPGESDETKKATEIWYGLDCDVMAANSLRPAL